MAEKLFEVAKDRQVLCVTHLPQIAAMGDVHFSVEKGEAGGRTFTAVERLDRERRRQELARLTQRRPHHPHHLEGAERCSRRRSSGKREEKQMMSAPIDREKLAEAMAQPGWVAGGQLELLIGRWPRMAQTRRTRALVHWKSWQESYQGIVDPRYLLDLALDKCVEIARKWPENTIVAVEQRIVGFVSA